MTQGVPRHAAPAILDGDSMRRKNVETITTSPLGLKIGDVIQLNSSGKTLIRQVTEVHPYGFEVERVGIFTWLSAWIRILFHALVLKLTL